MSTVKVYVRKGADNNSRIISFDRPINIPVPTLLEKGLAIDGSQVTFAVTGSYARENGWTFEGPFVNYQQSLPDALAAEEKALITFLAEYGLEAEFV